MKTRKIFATGGSRLPEKCVEFVRALGRHIIRDTEYQMITGGLRERDPKVPTADNEYVIGALEALEETRIDPAERLITMLPEADFARAKRFHHGTIIRVEKADSRSRRYSMVLSSDVVIAVAGDKGTREVMDLARMAKKPVFPVPGTGGAAEKFWRKHEPDLAARFQISQSDLELLQVPLKAPEPAAAACVALLRRVLRPSCFVAMKIAHPMPNCYEVMCRALDKKGYIPVRVDRESFTGSIVEAIWRYIRHADIVIADLTGDNLNVYYELGIGHAYGKQTFLTVYDPHGRIPASVPFDIREQRILPYGTETTLLTQLERHLPEA